MADATRTNTTASPAESVFNAQETPVFGSIDDNLKYRTVSTKRSSEVESTNTIYHRWLSTYTQEPLLAIGLPTSLPALAVTVFCSDDPEESMFANRNRSTNNYSQLFNP